MLEDYPGLLSYAIDEFFTHARLTQKHGSDIHPTFRRLSENKIWNCWLTLAEEEDPDSIEFDVYLPNEGFLDLLQQMDAEEDAIVTKAVTDWVTSMAQSAKQR
ncbi:hypothetical protein B0T14DRAFT_571849 [Immersiella caudata]|uniref:Uncharacterized protein n=1 Tax=Immersiella caudata TaxID=314043 RepID=A0AA39TP05_9PEZI|nr:hypothetical protein B0T14DRAFT_571849 [Immersiella caudata]